MKNINIPEPCSEDWNEMTPNEKGAFCKKCALDVYDFTNKSPDEIRQVLTLNMANPVCMRIEPTQLDKLNSDFSAWKIQNKQTYQRAWIFTLIVVFGMTLFSCEEDEEPVVKEYQKIGQAILNQAEGMAVNTLPEKDIEVKTIAVDDIESSQVKEVTKIECLKGDVLGKASYSEGEVPQKVHVIEEVRVVPEVLYLQETYTTAGIPAMSPEYDTYLLDTYEGVISDSLEFKLEPEITGLAYPNPASNQTTIQVEMPKKGKAEIELFTMTGQKISTIHSGRIKKGKSEYSIDLTGLETGMYLVVVYSGEMKETIKFSKI